MKEAIKYWWNHFWTMTIQSPKSTFSGLFSAVGLVSAGLLAEIPKSYAKLDLIILCIAAGCELAVKCITADTGKQLAKLPNVDQPQMVDSHEVPDQKGAVAVVPDPKGKS